MAVDGDTRAGRTTPAGDDVREFEPLANWTLIRSGGPARCLIRVGHPDQLAPVLDAARTRRERVWLLGNGSNVVVSDRGLDGIVVVVRDRRPVYRFDGNRLTVSAGASWPSLAVQAARRGLSGLHAGLGIPGTIGGAITMNAGIPASTIADRLVLADVVRVSDGRSFTLGRDELAFGHRSSHILDDGDLAVRSATFVLDACDGHALMADMKALQARRREEQPYALPSAGCIFRRSEGVMPGLLIDRAGCKGMREGDAEVSTLHANFIVNRGAASADEIHRLALRVAERVRAASGIELQREVQFLGDFTAP